MKSLNDIQNDFMQYIWLNDANIIDEIKADKIIEKEKRLQIYKNNLWLTLTEILKSAYPVTCEIVSSDFFDYLAHEYIKNNPSNSGDINNFGNNFSNFISNFKPLIEHQYLPDIAKIEWLRHLSYLSNEFDSNNLDLNNLSLQPYVYLLKSDYASIHIWDLIHNKENLDFDSFELSKPSFGLITRIGFNTETILIDDKLYNLLKNIKFDTSFHELIKLHLQIDNSEEIFKNLNNLNIFY